MDKFGWDYPPGVTGNEYEIAGPDYEKESDVPCATCGEPTYELGYQGDCWLVCNMGHRSDLEPREPDPDVGYDAMREKEMFGEDDFDPADTDLGNDETTMLGQPW